MLRHQEWMNNFHKEKDRIQQFKDDVMQKEQEKQMSISQMKAKQQSLQKYKQQNTNHLTNDLSIKKRFVDFTRTMQLMSMEAQEQLLKEQEKVMLKALQEHNEKVATQQHTLTRPATFAELAGSKPAM